MLRLPTEFKNEFKVESSFFSIDEHSMHYIEKGEGEQTVIMLHGNPTWVYYYRFLQSELSKNFKTYSIDHLNCGLSSRSKKFWRLKDRIEHVLKFIKEKDLKNITLVGHDWGGAIATGVAVEVEERVNNLVLMNTACFFSLDIPKRIAICRLPVIGTFLNQTMNGFLKASFLMATSKGLNTKEKEMYTLPYKSSDLRQGIDNFVSDIPMEKDHPTREKLDHVEMKARAFKKPVLLLWGAKDFCFNLGFYEKIKTIFPHAEKRLFKDGNHYILEDKKDECIELIKRFIS